MVPTRTCQLLVATLFVAAICPWPSPLAAEEPLSVELASAGEWIAADGSIELIVSRFPDPAEARLAIVVAGSDRTDLFRRTPRGLAYRSDLMRLPPGESEIVVSLVNPAGVWRELVRLPLKVRNRAGFERARFSARGVATGLEPADSAAEGPALLRGVPQSGWSAQLSGDGEAVRGGWTVRPALQFVGASEEGQRLRFASEGDEAPSLDLASYGLELAHAGGASFALGHLNLSTQRLLSQNFQARGLRAHLPLGSRVSFGFSASSGSLEVGWDRLLGFDRSEHRVLSGTLGFELLPRAGGLRLEGTWLSGRVTPTGSFNRGFVAGAEESRGWGLRLAGSSPAGRLRWDGGFARMRFENRSDRELESGLPVVASEAETRDARYAELIADLARWSSAGGESSALTLVLRHQRVDPLYRVVGLFLQADREENSAELQLSAGPLRATLIAAGFADNLDDIPTLLETRNRRRGATLALPLASLFAASPEPTEAPASPRLWLPVLSYAFDRNHQFGDGVPVGGGFDDTQVPDQVSVLHNLGLDWQGARWRLGYRFNQSEQDNRQRTRERADFATASHSLSLAGTLATSFDLGLDLTRERAQRKERDEIDVNERLGLNLTWRLPRSFTFLATVGETRSRDRRDTRESNAFDADVQLAWAFPEWKRGAHGLSGQLFLRYGLQESDALDRVFLLSTDSRRWVLAGGASINLF